MPQKVKAVVSDMIGHETKNLVISNECLALGDDLQPRIMGSAITVALPTNFGEYHIAAVGLLSVVTRRKINFMFVSQEMDKNWCEADICLLPWSKLWGGDRDVWETMISVVKNTQWFLDKFQEPQAAEGFFRSLYNEYYDGLEDIMALDRLEGRTLEKTAVHLLMYCQQRMSTLLKLQQFKDKMLHEVHTEVLKDRPGILVVPESSSKLPLITLLEWIALCVREARMQKDNPAYVIVLRWNDSWRVYPALELEDTGKYREVKNMRYPFKLQYALSKYKCKAVPQEILPYIICPDSNTAIAVAVWMNEKRLGNKTKLEEIVKK